MELLTVDEAAKMLRISSVSVRRYVAAGRLPAVRVGRSVRIDQAAVERLATPIPPADADPPTPAVQGHIFTFESPLWDLVGIIEDGPSDLAENHDKYLADAYGDLHDR
jgi:excisionase family DNA binding protein